MSKTNPPDDRQPPSTIRPTAAPLLNVPSPDGPPPDLGALGKYKLLKQIGKGGMGSVYLAQDTDLDRDVAIKTLLPEIAQVQQHRERFLREARLAAKIKHPNVITIYTVEEIDDTPLIVMERLKGQSLEDYIRKGGQLGPLQITRIIKEMLSGLEAAHKLGMIHRDIKPANVWLEAPKGKVRVLDFGLAVRPEQDLRISMSGMVMGTPHYMPPEQAMGKKVDHRADLFSVGVVLYRMCTGQLPFEGESLTAILIAVATQTPITPSQLNPIVPPAMDDLILRLLSKNPSDRPADAAEVLAILAKPMPWGAGASKLPGAAEPAVPIEAVPDTVYPPPQSGQATSVPADTVRPPVPPLAVPEEPDEDDLDRAAGRFGPLAPLSSSSANPAITPLPLPPGGPQPRRSKRVLLVGAILGLAAAGGSAFVLTDGFGKRDTAALPPPTSKPSPLPPVVPPPTKERDEPPPPPPPPPARGSGTLVLSFDEQPLDRLYGSAPRGRSSPSYESDLAVTSDIVLLIDGQGFDLAGKVILEAGSHTVQMRRGSELLFRTPQAVTVRADESTSLRIPSFPTRDGRIILVFGKLPRATVDNVLVFVDGRARPLDKVSVSATTGEGQLSLTLPVGEHRFAVRHRGAELFSKADTVKPFVNIPSYLPVALYVTSTVRLRSSVPVGPTVTAYAYIDGKQDKQWPVGATTLELEVEVGKHQIESKILLPRASEGRYLNRQVDAKSGETVEFMMSNTKQ